MIASAALFLVCTAISADPATNEPLNTNAVLAELADQDPLDYYVSQVPGNNAGGGARPSLDTQATNNTSRRTSSGNPYARLARVPNMFGDSLPPNGQIVFNTLDAGGGNSVGLITRGIVAADVPLAGGSRYVPIGENNKPIPVDRVFFTFNGFNNAVSTVNVLTGQQSDANIYRYTFGLEKTFFDKWASIEVRLPLTNQFGFIDSGVNLAGGNMGNLNLVYKQVFYRTEQLVMATGVGLGLPTGSATKGTIFGNQQTFQIGNQSTYVLPYIGAAYTGDNDFFAIAYAQLDVAASGDRLQVDGVTQGILNAPTFARFDVSTGYWLLRNVERPYLSGVALVGEMHYITSLAPGDQITATQGTRYDFGYNGNRYDFLNTTVGVHWQITDLSNFRIGGVFPLKTGQDRQFDSELQMSFNRMF